MEEKNKNEELQSRREFFKRAAKGALPILAAVALASAPNLINAATEAPMGCNKGCAGTCYGNCVGSCRTGCTRTCSGWCSETCKGHCKGGNKND